MKWKSLLIDLKPSRFFLLKIFDSGWLSILNRSVPINRDLLLASRLRGQSKSHHLWWWIFTLIGLICMTGCGGPYYYDLHIDPADNNRSFQSEKILKVEDVESIQIYWNSGIVIRSSPYKIKHEAYRRWAKTPGDLVKDAIIYYYRNHSLFRGVVSDYSLMDPDLVMRIKIEAIEMCRVDKKWFARLGLYIEISDAEKEEVILTHSFDRQKPIKGKKVEYLPPKISEILEEELLILEEKLINILRLNGPSEGPE